MNDHQFSDSKQTTIEENLTSLPSNSKSLNYNPADVIFDFIRGILGFLRSFFYGSPE